MLSAETVYWSIFNKIKSMKFPATQKHYRKRVTSTAGTLCAVSSTRPPELAFAVQGWRCESDWSPSAATALSARTPGGSFCHCQTTSGAHLLLASHPVCQQCTEQLVRLEKHFKKYKSNLQLLPQCISFSRNRVQLSFDSIFVLLHLQQQILQL